MNWGKQAENLKARLEAEVGADEWPKLPSHVRNIANNAINDFAQGNVDNAARGIDSLGENPTAARLRDLLDIEPVAVDDELVIEEE
jgi:hypothetical protein